MAKRKRKVAPKVDMTLEENMFRYVIPEDADTPITNQKQEGTCQKWATADMATIVLRREFPSLVTSPQILIDRNPNLCDLIAYCVDEDKGLESVNDYPVIRIARNLAKGDEIKYQTSKRERFRIQRLVYCSDLNEIIARILGMFCDGGYRYPCVCVLRLGELSDPDVARRHALGLLPPYRHSRPVPRNNKQASKSHGVQHAMLITGVDTTSEDPNEHYCVVKNTYGTSWGYGGRSRVGFEVFEYVLFPVHKEKEEREKEKMEKEVRKKRKMEKKVEERPEGGDDGGYAKTCKERMEAKMEVVDNGGADGGGKSTKKRSQENGDDGRDADGDRSIKKKKKPQDKEKPRGERGGRGKVTGVQDFAFPKDVRDEVASNQAPSPR